MINVLLDKLDLVFAGKRINDKRIMFAVPTLILFFLIYQFEVPMVESAQKAKKEQIASLELSARDISLFVKSAPNEIKILSQKEVGVKAQINAEQALIKELNEKVSISDIRKYSKERSAIVMADIYEIASKQNVKLNSAKAMTSDSNLSGFAPNSKIALTVWSSSFTSLLAFIDKIEEINEPISIKSMSIDNDLNATILIDVWGHDAK